MPEGGGLCQTDAYLPGTDVEPSARSSGSSSGSSRQASANSSREKGVSAMALVTLASSRQTRKKFTTSPSRSLYVSTGDGGRFRRTAAEPANGSQ